MAQQTRPLIGLNADLIPRSKTTTAQLRIHLGYLEAIAAAGGLPVVLPPFEKGLESEPLLERFDGFVLTGSADLDPRRLGLPPQPALQPVAERREQSDQRLIRWVSERRAPLLAIGLGMLELNLACAGKLYGYLPGEMPQAMPHRDPRGELHRHTVLLEPSTRLEEIYGGTELCVNSAHWQAVRQAGAGLRVAARAPDGVIEAVEATEPSWFCVGVQWQPECETATALDLQLFESFVQACLRRAESFPAAA
jgi:putative glutamine amidotransferase